MVLHTPLDYPIRTANSTTLSTSSQLRQRKLLPPLSSSPTELSMAALGGSTSTDPLATDDYHNNNDANNHDANANANDATAKADEAKLLQLHMQFARAFKLNDAAQLLPCLDKDVALTTLDGHVVRGASAVLGCLVGPKMSKLSGGVHVKQARPARCGDWQSAFVYEHGLVFKEPLYSEVVDWKADPSGGYVATRITHTRLSSNNTDNGPPKSVADVVKVVASLPYRLSLSDDDDNNGSVSLPPSSSCARRASAPASTSNQTRESESHHIGAVVTRMAVTTKLSPIRKRKLVNAFLTVESEDGVLLWKSSVAKKQLLPVWSGIDLEFPPPLEDDVVVTLWDYSFFRSLRVATAQTSAAQLLHHERNGLASLELKPMGLSFSSVELTFSIARLSDARAWRPRSMSIVSTIAAVDAAMAAYDDNDDEESTTETTAFVQKTSVVTVDSAWLMATSALGVLLVCVALLWLHTSGQLMTK